MGRGAQTETRCQIDQQLAAQTAMNQELYRKNEELSNRLASGYQNQLANPGYTPEQQAAIRNQSMGSLASAFGALAQNAANRTARTRNTAGYNDLLAEISREQGRQAARLVHRILTGTPPRELPVELPDRFEFIINLKTAKRLGLQVPGEVLSRANRVIK